MKIGQAFCSDAHTSKWELKYFIYLIGKVQSKTRILKAKVSKSIFFRNLALKLTCRRLCSDIRCEV